MEDIIKQQLKSIGLGIAYVIGFILIVSYFKLGTWGIIGLLCISSIITNLYQYWKTKVLKIKSFFIGIIAIVAIVHIFKYTGFWLGLFLTCGLILFTKRKQYMFAKHHIETKLFGKPLYKYREKGKKPPKIGLSHN